MTAVPSAFQTVKVQRPLNPTERTTGLLVYAKGRVNMVEQPLTPRLETMMGQDLKAYFRAVWVQAEGVWQIEERVSAESW